MKVATTIDEITVMTIPRHTVTDMTTTSSRETDMREKSEEGTKASIDTERKVSGIKR